MLACSVFKQRSFDFFARTSVCWGVRKRKQREAAFLRQHWVRTSFFAWTREGKARFFLFFGCFARLCEVMTIDHELWIAKSDCFTGFINLSMHVRNKSQCVWGATKPSWQQPFGVSLAAIWRVLGGSWEAFRTRKSILVVSYELLGASTGSWIDLGTTSKAKMEPKSVPTGGQNQLKIRPRFTSALKQQ